MPDRLTVFWHDDALHHDTGAGVFEAAPSEMLAHQMPHPENAERIANMKRALEAGPAGSHICWAQGRHATDSEILRVHETAYLDELKAAEKKGSHAFTGTTMFAKGSLAAIRAAAGTSLAALDHVLGNDAAMAHALVRPPGHHAQPAYADGYCFVNNCAVAAAAALQQGLERIAIIDWDVHHGNGTQACFYDRDDVLTISMHMDHGSWGAGYHPQTGDCDEKGAGPGLGYNLNIDLPLGVGDETYLYAFEKIIAPRVRSFEPDLLIVANGQDANQFDPNGRQLVTVAGFHRLGQAARNLALELTGGKLLSIQEGGYNPAYAALCAHATIEGFLGLDCNTPDPIAFMPEDVGQGRAAVERIAAALQ